MVGHGVREALRDDGGGEVAVADRAGPPTDDRISFAAEGGHLADDLARGIGE